MPAQGSQVPAVAELPEVVPLEGAEVFLIVSGPLALQQLQETGRLAGFPGLVGEVHLSGIQVPASRQLALLGELLALARQTALLLGLGGVVLGELLLLFGLRRVRFGNR
jgi:hypothetical protein